MALVRPASPDSTPASSDGGVGGLILWPSWPFLVVVVGVLVIWVHIRLKKVAERERAEDEAQYRAQETDKDRATSRFSG